MEVLAVRFRLAAPLAEGHGGCGRRSRDAAAVCEVE